MNKRVRLFLHQTMRREDITRLQNSCWIELFSKNTEAATEGSEVTGGVLKNFANSTGKYLCWSPVHEVGNLQSASFFKKRLQQKCFPVKFAKLLRITILRNICKWLLLEVFYKKVRSWKFCNIYRMKIASDKCSVKKLIGGW